MAPSVIRSSGTILRKLVKERLRDNIPRDDDCQGNNDAKNRNDDFQLTTGAAMAGIDVSVDVRLTKQTEAFEARMQDGIAVHQAVVRHAKLGDDGVTDKIVDERDDDDIDGVMVARREDAVNLYDNDRENEHAPQVAAGFDEGRFAAEEAVGLRDVVHEKGKAHVKMPGVDQIAARGVMMETLGLLGSLVVIRPIADPADALTIGCGEGRGQEEDTTERNHDSDEKDTFGDHGDEKSVGLIVLRFVELTRDCRDEHRSKNEDTDKGRHDVDDARERFGVVFRNELKTKIARAEVIEVGAGGVTVRVVGSVVKAGAVRKLVDGFVAVCSHIREVEGSPSGGDDHQNVKNMVEEQFELNREILNDFRHGSHPGVFTGVMILQRIAGADFDFLHGELGGAATACGRRHVLHVATALLERLHLDFHFALGVNRHDSSCCCYFLLFTFFYVYCCDNN